MKKLLKRFESFWLEDLSFVFLLIMLFCLVFIIPILMPNSSNGILYYNIILLTVFFSGIFSTQNTWLKLFAGSLFVAHLLLRIIRFTENPLSYYITENVIAIINSSIFIYINFRLLFRDSSVNIYRIIGAINIYLLVALMGALTLEVINATTGVSIKGNITLIGSDEDYEHFIYFSLVSLTTVGFGDIYPASSAAKMFSVFLSTVGILFPSIVIAKLITLSSDNK